MNIRARQKYYILLHNKPVSRGKVWLFHKYENDKKQIWILISYVSHKLITQIQGVPFT